MAESTNTQNPFQEQINMLLRGKRPEGMNYHEFRVKRKAVQLFLKRKSKGRFFYVAKETVTETNPETGIKELVTKIYNPYKKQKQDGE